MNDESEIFDFTNPANLIGKKIKYTDQNGEVVEDVVISFTKNKEDNYMKLFLVNN